jgi:hypothetical protein
VYAIEELLGRNSSGSCPENRDYGSEDHIKKADIYKEFNLLYERF